MKLWIVPVFALSLAARVAAQAPPPEAFRVFPGTTPEGPVIASYLKFQVEKAWDEDEQRRHRWQSIHSEKELLDLQQEMHQKLLSMLGGLPEQRTPLHPKLTGTVQMDGFHIEKLIYQSLPGIYVTALVYVPEGTGKKHPAVLVPSGHAAKGKLYYQALCQRLVQHGYVVIAWDPVGQGERSQFWDTSKGKSRYNLICAEHAVLGNLAFLAGTNLARWEIWDGIRAIDYLLTRDDVDPERINITGSSGGGTQTAYIAALDSRIKVSAPSCYITALPMRMYNRIFKDPDSDPEQDLNGMVSSGIDHPGLLLMRYPKPVFLAAAVLDFFPIEGTHKSFREVSKLYGQFGHDDRIAMHEGYHDHQYSLENQTAMLEFMDRFNGIPFDKPLSPVKELDEKTLQCTRSGQVMLDFEDARSLIDEIRDFYTAHKQKAHPTLKQTYFSGEHANAAPLDVKEYTGSAPTNKQILHQSVGKSQVGDIEIERFVLHHSVYLSMPLLWIHKTSGQQRPTLLWLGDRGKATEADWPELSKFLAQGYNIVTVDPRGRGEDRMPYKAISPDDPTLAKADFEEAYTNPLSGVLADYVYNSVLIGRPYLLQAIEDVEIASRFAREQLRAGEELSVTGKGRGYTLASAVAETLPHTKLLTQPALSAVNWSEIVDQKQELWPIEFLLPGGAYIH